MKNPYYLLTLFFVALSVSGCDKSYDETCSELNPKYFQLDQLCFSSSDEAKNDDKVYILNSEADLKANLLLKTNTEGCDDFNNLYDTDFSKYTLIIGQKKFGEPNSTTYIQDIA